MYLFHSDFIGVSKLFTRECISIPGIEYMQSGSLSHVKTKAFNLSDFFRILEFFRMVFI